MTVVSCLAIGLGFCLAVALLFFAGTVIGMVIPRRIRRPRGRGPAVIDPPRSGD